MSALGTYALGQRPLAGSPTFSVLTLSITAPRGVIDGAQQRVEWIYSASNGLAQHSYRLTLTTPLGTVLTDTGWVVGAATSHVLDWTFAGNSAYVVELRVRTSQGQEAIATSPFLVQGSTQAPPPNLDVGKLYDVAINGVGYMLAEADQLEWQRRTIALDAPRFATGEAPFNDAIERYSFLGQNDWSGGAGQLEADRTGAIDTAFFDSDGIDPFTERGELRLLPATGKQLTSAYADLRFTALGNHLYVVDGPNTLSRFMVLGAAGNAFTIAAAGTISDIVSDGRFWYAADGTGVWRSSNPADPGAAWSTEDVVRMTWAGGRLCCAVIGAGSTKANVFKTLLDDGAQESLRLTLPVDYEITSLSGGGGHLYFAAVAGNVGAIYAWKIGSTDAPFVVWDLPAAETPQSVYWYQNNLFVRAERSGQVAIYRCAVKDDGYISPFLLTEIDPASSTGGDFVGRGRFVFFSWPAMDGTHGGVGCVDLASGGYAKWIKATEPAQGPISCIQTWQGRTVFAVAGLGVFYESSTPVASGHIDTSIRDGGSALEKVWDEIMLQSRPLGGGATIEVAYSLDRGDSYVPFPAGTLSGNGQFRRSTKLGVTSPSIGWRLTLKGDGARLRVVQVRGHPLGLADSLLVLPIHCGDDITFRNGRPGEGAVGDGARRLRQLEAMAQSQVRVQDIDWQETRLVEDYEVLGVEARRIDSVRDPSGGQVISYVVAIVTLRRTSGSGQQVGRTETDSLIIVPSISVEVGLTASVVTPSSGSTVEVHPASIAARAGIGNASANRGTTVSVASIAASARPGPVTIATTGTPPSQQKRGVIGLHGTGGGLGPGGYGSNANFPYDPAGSFVTIETTNLGNSYRANGVTKTTGIALPGGYAYSGANRAAVINYLQAIIDAEQFTHVTIVGFGNGGGMALSIAAGGETFGGKLVGVIADDPTFFASGVNRNANVKLSLWAVRTSSGSWAVDDSQGFNSIAQVQTAFGVTAQANPYFNSSHPMARNNGTGAGPTAPPEVFTTAWWGTTTPPPSTTVTIPGESFTLVNPAPSNGMLVQANYGGFHGTGYIGRWYQSGEIVRTTYEAAAAGNYTIDVRYRTANVGSSRIVRINGTQVMVKAFPQNVSAWTETTWSVESITVPLVAGINTIEFVVGNLGLDIDEITISSPGGTTPPPSGTHPMVIGGVEIFPKTNFMYADISTLPARSDSAARIAGSMALPTFRPEWGPSPWNNNEVYPDFGPGLENGRRYGYPVIIAEANAPTFPIVEWRYSYSQGESDNVALPIPLNTLQEHNGDYHILCVQKGTNRLFEVWDAHPVSGGWSVGQATMWDLTSHNMRPVNITSANAAGMPMLPGSINYDEVAAGQVTHAASICMTYVSAEYEWPANHVADTSSGVRGDLMKMGTWLRLKSSVNLDARNLGPQARVIAEGLKKHGAIVIDVGPKWKLNATADDRWNRADLVTLMNLNGNDFEVVDTSGIQISPRTMQAKTFDGTTPPPPPPPPTTTGNDLPSLFASTHNNPTEYAFTIKGIMWGVDHFPDNAEMQRYREANVTFFNGGKSVVLEARNNDPASPTGWSSGATYQQNAPVQPGEYIQARVKCPVGKGFWPAFWLLPTNEGTQFEVDIMEHLGAADRFDSNYHEDTNLDGALDMHVGKTVLATTTDWFNIGVHLDTTKTDYYLNGQLVWSVARPVTKPMYPILNFAVGGNYPGFPDSTTPNIAQYEIASVKKWAKITTQPGTGTGRWEIASNGEFVNPQGRRTRLVGANGAIQEFGPNDQFIFNYPIAGGGGARSFLRVPDIQTWGWNCVRVCSVSGASPGGIPALVQKMSAFIDACAAAGIVVLATDFTTPVGANPSPGSMTSTDEYWRQLIAARGDNPYLWINYSNEPVGDGPGSVWLNLSNYAYNLIRSQPKGANTMIVIDAPFSGQGGPEVVSGGQWGSYASGKHHTVLSWHAYAAFGGASYAENGRSILNNANVPWMVGEFAYQANHAGGACCGANFANQRATALKIINEWVPAGESALWWIATGDSSGSIVHSLRTPDGTYQDYGSALSEAGQPLWNQRTSSKDLGPA